MNDHIEYRERTASWDPETGHVELYLAQKRDYTSAMARINRTGVTPVSVEELQPGYRIVLRGGDYVLPHMGIRKKRELSEVDRKLAAERLKAFQFEKAA